MANITVENIINISQPLICNYIVEQEDYQKDITKIFNGVENKEILFSLLTSENDSYSEERTLKIAEILEKASEKIVYDEATEYIKRHNWSITDVRISFSLDSFRKKPALYFYERAVAHNSIKAMVRVASLLKSGEGNIEPHLERSEQLYKYAAERGDIESLLSLDRDNSYYKSMIANGAYLAEIVLFIRCFEDNKMFFAKRHLNKLIKACNKSDKDNIIDYLKSRDQIKFLSVIRYIRGESKKIRSIN